MKIIMTTLLLIGSIAQANFDLSKNGKKMTCYADDNQSWEINISRTKIKYSIEGESLGAKRIFDRQTDGQSVVTYSTSEGTLTLSNEKDTFQFADADDSFEITCE